MFIEVNTNMLKALAKGTIAFVGVMGAGYLLMVKTSPSKEEMMKRLPPHYVTDAKMKEIEKQNELVFDQLKRAMNSDEPVWKMKENPLEKNK